MSLCHRTKSPSSGSSSSFSEDCDDSVKDVSYCPSSPKSSISNHDSDEEIISRPTCLHDTATVVESVLESDDILNSEEPCTSSSITASSTLILGSPLKKGRKRKKQPEKWKANLIKKKRNSGKEYETHTLSKKVRPARKMKTPCVETCKFKCFQNFSEEERKQLFTLYWGLGDIEKQRQYICNCMAIVEPRYRYVRIGGTKGPRQPNNAFYFKKGDNQVRVCKRFFMNTLDINDRPIMTVLKKREKLANQILEPDQRGKHDKHKKLDPNLKAGVKQFIDKIPKIESHYTRRNTSKTYIEGSKTIKSIYDDYVKQCKEKMSRFAPTYLSTDVLRRTSISLFSSQKKICVNNVQPIVIWMKKKR